ncbi:MAG: DUF5615 family PIN-like protein [Bacteroidia bacterium]
MKLVADENLNGNIIRMLKERGHEVYEIGQNHQGISDREIIQLIADWESPLLTEDKDFGELVFAYKLNDVSVIFLRYDNPDIITVNQRLLAAIDFLEKNDNRYFITITALKTRIIEI